MKVLKPKEVQMSKKSAGTLVAGRPVLVTTAHRGVFFGYFKGHDGNGTVTLTKMRNCVYWPASVKGFLGLASTGPLDGSRVGPAVESATLYGVTAIAAVTADAVKRWEEFPWK
jgi:hypothetical protein